MIESLLLSVTRIATFRGLRLLTRASAFFFARDGRLFLVTSRHVLIDYPSEHLPDRIEIELHVDPDNMTRTIGFSILLYQQGCGIWRQGRDSDGDVDVAIIELDLAKLPAAVVLCAFTPQHLQRTFDDINVGDALSIVGFPLGFHDTLHHMPVVRQGAIASSFGLRFQGRGLFLTDARLHRGTSGAPVVMRAATADSSNELPWKLLGVHSSRVDMRTRDLRQDETLGLNYAWYADILLPLTIPLGRPLTPA